MMTSDRPHIRVLLVDDDEEDFFITRELLSDIEATRFSVTWEADADRVFDRLNSGEEFDICLLDYRMGRRNGLDVLREIVAAGHSLPIILLTGQDDSHVDREAVRLGASDYLVKGQADAVLLERSIRYAIRQKHIEEELRQQTEFVSAVLDTARALVLVVDRHGNLVRFNNACVETSGYTFEEVANRDFSFLIPEHERERVAEVFKRLISGEFPIAMENEWCARDGQRKYIAFSNTCLTDREGKVAYIVATGIDITARRRAEAALAEARNRELEVGSSIQKTLLVRKAPQGVAGVEIGATTRSAQRVGGDYLDFFVYDNRCIDVLVGDVMGKGVPAALLAAATKSHFQRVVRRLSRDMSPFNRLPEPQEIVAAVHQILTPELYRLCSFVTLNYARFNLDQQTLTYVDCGHPGLIYVNPCGKPEMLSGTNVPLGMSLTEQYRQKTVHLSPGDLFCFYSDGLFEATNHDEEPFSIERLIESMGQLQDLPPQEMAERLCAEVDDFAMDGTVDDDRTCVIVKIAVEPLPERRSIHRTELPARLPSLEKIRAFVEQALLEGAGKQLPDDDVYRILLAVHEAATNIIRHAYQRPEMTNDGDSADSEFEDIQVTVECLEDRVTVELRDTGEPFVEQESVPAPIFDGTREGGFGMFLIRQAVDEVVYQRDDFGRNLLCLTRKFPREQTLEETDPMNR